MVLLDDPERTKQIYDLLYSLGVTANYKGFYYISYAVCLCAEEPKKLLSVMNLLYPDVAAHFNTTVCAVERLVRRTLAQVWELNPQRIARMVGRDTQIKPKPAQFLAALTKEAFPTSLLEK